MRREVWLADVVELSKHFIKPFSSLSWAHSWIALPTFLPLGVAI